MELFKLFGSILIDNDEANASIAKTEKQAEGLGNRFVNGAKTVGKWGLAIGAAATAAAGGIFAATNAMTSDLDRIAKASDKLGVTTDAYQEMDYWASQNGISSSEMERAVGRLNQRIGMAADGNEKYSNALERLNVNMDDVRDGTVSTEDAMATAIQSLSEMESQQEKSAMAAELFGTKLGRELMPALQDGSLSLDEAREKAEELGIVVGEDSIRQAEEFQDSWDNITRSFKTVGRNILIELMPIFQRLMDWVQDHMPQIQAVMQRVFGVVGDVVNVVVDVFDTHLLPIFSRIYDWVMANMPQIQAGVGGTFERIQEIITTFVEIVSVFWERWGDTIVDIVTWIAETIPGIIDAALDIIQGILDVFIGIFTGDWERFGEGIKTIWSGIWKAVETVVSGVITAAFTWGKDIVMGLVEGIKNVAMAPVRAMQDIAEGIGGAVVGFFGNRSPSTLMMKYGKEISEGLQIGMDSVGIKYPLPELAGVGVTNRITHDHTGVLRIEGVNDQGQFVSSAQVVIDELRREMRT